MTAQAEFLAHLHDAVTSGAFVKLTLSKPPRKSAEWRNAYARLIELRGELVLSFTLRYSRRDETKNYEPEEGLALVGQWLGTDFLNADLFTLESHWSLQLNRKGEGRLRYHDSLHEEAPDREHDRTKNHPLALSQPAAYLHALGITGADGQVLQKGRRKFRQINKYIEIIGHLLEAHPLPRPARIVDMGSGKGYLTFALYDYLTNVLRLDVQLTGVELRPDLVDFCNQLAKDSGFTQLNFVAGSIEDYQPTSELNMLIALHACDTATDEALAKGVQAGADVLVVAPCCQKQVRRDMRPTGALSPLLQHGILLERQAELLTDGLRALLLEAAGYRTKVFEFVNTEHTPKNLMITALKGEPDERAAEQVEAIKREYGVTRHRLEELI